MTCRLLNMALPGAIGAQEWKGFGFWIRKRGDAADVTFWLLKVKSSSCGAFITRKRSWGWMEKKERHINTKTRRVVKKKEKTKGETNAEEKKRSSGSQLCVLAIRTLLWRLFVNLWRRASEAAAAAAQVYTYKQSRQQQQQQSSSKVSCSEREIAHVPCLIPIQSAVLSNESNVLRLVPVLSLSLCSWI